MKTYGEPIRVVMPSGNMLPRAPVPGEVYHLDVNMPLGDPLLPWYPKGAYVWNGQNWMQLNGTGQKRAAAPIGARMYEVEIESSPKDRPTRTRGFPVAELVITPTHPKATISGQASMWVHHSKPAHVWLVLFRKDKIASIVVQFVDAGKPTNMSLTFYDIPNSHEDQQYSLRIYTDVLGMLGVNSCTKFAFDGLPETAFIVEQNS